MWMLALNASHVIGPLALPEALVRPGYKVGLYQLWELYAPRPRRHAMDRGFVGFTEDGSVLELADGPADARWQHVRDAHADYRLRSLLAFGMDRSHPGHPALRESYLAWICRERNASEGPGPRFREVQLIGALRRLHLDGQRAEPRGYGEMVYDCENGAVVE